MNDVLRRTVYSVLAKTRIFVTALVAILIFSFVGSFNTTSATSPITLGAAGNFAVLAGAGITNTGAASIAGDVGSYPTSTITGIPGCNGCLAGTNHLGDSVTQTARTNLQTAITNLTSYPTTHVVTTDLGGQTLSPGVYGVNNINYFMSINGILTLKPLHHEAIYEAV